MCASEFIFQMFISIQVFANYKNEMNITKMDHYKSR